MDEFDNISSVHYQWPELLGYCVCERRADVNQLTVDNEHAETMCAAVGFIVSNEKHTESEGQSEFWYEANIERMQRIAVRFYTWLFVSQHQ